MNKPFKTLSTAALAAVFASSALVPVASAEVAPAQAASLSKIIVEYKGQNVALTVSDYSDLLDAGKINPATVKYVELSTGDKYTLDAYSEALDAFSNVEDTAEYLAEKGTPSEVKDVKDGSIKDGEIQVEDETPSEETIAVESVKAINTTGVTVTIAALQADVEGATIEVKDPAGNVVSVVAQNLKKGTTEVTFPFTVVPEKIAAGTWTVEGKTFEIVSNDASFANLVSNIGTWNTPFNPTAETQTYEVLVDVNAKAVDFTPTAAEGTTITMSYTADDKKINSVVQNGKANAVTLGKEAAVAGQLVTFTVIAPDQKTSATYTVTIKQAAANANDNATLSTLTVTDNAKEIITFDQTKDSYSAIVPFATNTVTVKPTAAAGAGAKVYIDGKIYKDPTNVNLAVGQNKIEVKVVAEDNKTEKVYTINVERTEEGAAKVNTLNSLTLSDGTLEGFKADDATAKNLTTKVGNKVEDLTITPIATHGKAKIEVTAKNDKNNLEVVQDGAAYTIKGLKEDNKNDVIISVTPANGGAAQTYKLTVERAKATASDIAQLSAFNAVYDTNKNLFGTNDFKPTTEEYSYNVKNDVKELTLTTTPATGGKATATINGVAVAADNKAALKIGENIIKVKVVAADAVTERTYTLKVNRASSTASDIATLNDIVLSDNAKLEGFTADDVAKKTASTTVGSDVNELTITPKATDAKANVTVTADGNKLEVVKNGGSYTIKGLKAGQNEVKISVQPESVKDSVDYTLTINKVAVSASDNAFLKDSDGIKLDNEVIADFKKDKYDYTAPVAFGKVSTKLVVAKADDKAKVTVNGKAYDAAAEHALKVGDNKFTIVVTAADGKTTKTYTVNVKRAAETASDVATLNKLDVSAGTLEGFTADKKMNELTDGLSVKVANDVKDLTLTPKATEAGATIEVTAKDKDSKDLEVVASNGAYTVKGLAEGDNKVTVKVTAANGVATESYEVTVNRVGAGADNNAKLTEVKATTPAVELKATNDAKTEYVTYVTNETAKVTFTATVVAGQSVLYDGEVLPLTTGTTATVAADLAPGQANEVKFTVLAADQKTTVDYKVIVHRAAADASADATLKAIESVSPGEIKDFKADTLNYDVIVPADTKVFKFKPVVNEANARVEVEGVENAKVTKNADGSYSVSLAKKANTTGEDITIKVTPANNTKATTYTLTVKTETPSDTVNATATIQDDVNKAIAAVPDNGTLNLNLEGATGDIKIEELKKALTINLTGNITGTLTVNTPESTVNNKATATGKITITDVSNATWNEFATGNTILFNDTDKGTKFVVGAGATVASLTVDGPAVVTNNGTVTALVVGENATGATISNTGTITTLTANVDVIVKGEQANAVDPSSKGTVAASPAELLLKKAELAKSYQYDPAYTYSYTDLTIANTQATITYDKATVTANPKLVMNDMARYLGALYRVDNGATITALDYKGKEYTWNGTLKGSNWKSGFTTLVSVITADFVANQDSFNTVTLQLKDAEGNTTDLTLKVVLTGN